MAERVHEAGPIRTAIWWAAAFAIGWFVIAMVPGAANLSALAEARPQLDLEPFWAAPFLTQLHLATVLIALVLGPIQLFGPKGTPAHRLIGWIWATAMMITAVATLFIREINHGQLSPIHFFSFWTIISLPLGVWFAKRGMIGAHRGTMSGLYVGLIIAGLLSAAPGRLTWDIFFG